MAKPFKTASHITATAIVSMLLRFVAAASVSSLSS